MRILYVYTRSHNKSSSDLLRDPYEVKPSTSERAPRVDKRRFEEAKVEEIDVSRANTRPIWQYCE